MVVTSSTQIPHIVRRVVGQALGRPWGDIRVIKPYIGGGFGNKQDALYEPLCAWCCEQVGGRCVKLDCSSPTVCATPSARTSSPSCGPTARSPRARSSASPIRVHTPRTVMASWPRAWARSRSSIRAPMLKATRTPSLLTGLPPAQCAATVSRRRCSRANRTSMTVPRRWASTRSSSGAHT